MSVYDSGYTEVTGRIKYVVGADVIFAVADIVDP